MNTLNLGYDMFDELQHNMKLADDFAIRITITSLTKLIGRDVEGINDIRFEIDETEVMVQVEYSYSDVYNNDDIDEDSVMFKLNDDMEFTEYA